MPVSHSAPLAHRATHQVARRLAGVEACRGAAAVMVVFYHVARHLEKAHGPTWLMGLWQFGHAGVDLFFVISGFIILAVHLDDIGRPGQLAVYARKRFLRIMPVYWVALALTLGLRLGGGNQGVPTLPEIAWAASLLPSRSEPLLGVAWTLQYELVFYGLFAVLILHRAAGLAALSAWAAWAAASGLGLAGAPVASALAGPYILEFLIGMAAAWYFRRGQVGKPRLLLAAGLGLFALAALLEDAALLDGYAAAARLVYGVPAGLIVLGLAEGSRRNLLTCLTLPQQLGAASYSLYLFHFAFIGLAWKLLALGGLATRLPAEALFVVLASSGIAGGIAMSRLVEFPLLASLRSRSFPVRGVPIRMRARQSP